MLILWLVLAFAAGYGTREWVTPRVRAKLAPPPQVEDRNAGLMRYKEFKRGS